MDGRNGFPMVVGAGVVGAILGVAGASFRSTTTPVPVAMQAVQDVVMARRFSLRGDRGVERAVLACGDNGGPIMSLFDSKGQARLDLKSDDGGSSVTFFDSTGKTRVMIADGPEGSLVSLADSTGEMRVWLGVMDNGDPTMCLADSTGKTRVWLNLVNDSMPRVVLADFKGQPRAAMGITDNGDPSMGIYDAGGRWIPMPTH